MNSLVPNAELGEELVRVALGVAQHEPAIVWAYFGPPEWLDEAKSKKASPESLLRRAKRLCQDAERGANAFIAAEADAMVAQLEYLLGDRPSYQDRARRLFEIDEPRPPADQVRQLRTEVVELAAQLVGGEEPVRRWENERGLTGEKKWDAALEAYSDGRRWLVDQFPLPITEDLELGRDSEYHSSVHMNWRGGSTMRLGINVSVPRTRETTRFEVAHNAYPGDYLRIAALSQHAYRQNGQVAACIKLKNAPESVISEGLEDTAYLRLVAHPSAEDLLATKLEWLRRGVAVTAAIMVRDEKLATSVVASYLTDSGFMSDERIANELRLIDHPVWGPYRAAYWPGRELISEADRRAQRTGKAADHLRFMFAELHTPRSLLKELDKFLAAAPIA